MKELKLFFRRLLDRGYQTTQLTPLFQQAMDNDKACLLCTALDHLGAWSKKETSHRRRVFLHLPYHPANPSSKTISSIRVLSVASLPCSSLIAESTPFFLTVLLTNLQNCLDDMVEAACSLRIRRRCLIFSVICSLRVIASALKNVKSFSFPFLTSPVPNPCKVLSYSSCLTCDSATMHFLRSFRIDLHMVT